MKVLTILAALLAAFIFAIFLVSGTPKITADESAQDGKKPPEVIRHLLNSFIELNNIALARFSREDRQRIGIHTCPGSDCDSTHSADVDYADLLPNLLQLHADNFYIALAGEQDRERVLKIIKDNLKPNHKIFVGVIAPINPRVETAEEVCQQILLSANYIPFDQLGSTDDCGFSPFSDDTSTSRDTAFAKIQARVAGTKLASDIIEGH